MSPPAPSVPNAGNAAPAPPTQPTRKADLVAVATEPVDELPVGIEQRVCTLTDLTVDEDTWVTAIEVVPQHSDYTFRASVSFSDSQGCDDLGILGEVVFDYYSSNQRLELKPGHALLLPARSYVNVHFHHSGLTATAPSTDTKLTEVRLWTLPKGERPTYRVAREIYHNLNITVPVDAVDEAASMRAEISADFIKPGAEIIGISPELHFLGQRVTAGVIAADGTETEYFDLQDWTIDARKDYLFDPGSYIPIQRATIHKQTCFYSNRAMDQPRDARGMPMTPQLTTFGEHARNEHCRMNVIYRYPIQ